MPVNDGSNIRITPLQPMRLPDMARETSSLLTAMRRASGGGGGRGRGDTIFNPLTKKYEWVPGADTKTRLANMAAQNAEALRRVWNDPNNANAKAIQEKLKDFNSSSVERQAQILDDIRQNDIPKLASGLGWDGQAFVNGPFAELVNQQKTNQKAVDETGALDTLWDSARIGWRNFTDSLADLGSSADEQITRATERQKYVEGIQAENAALRNRARRINEGADFTDRFGWDELAATTGEFLGENAATFGAALAGGGIGGLIARGIGAGARAAQALNYGGQAVAGIVPGAAQQLGASTNEILNNKDLSLDQKREALEDSYGPSTVFGAAMGAAVLPFGQMMNRGIANAWRRAGLGDSEVAKLVKARRAGEALPANASGSWSNALANARRADMEAENAIITGGIKGRLGQQFRDSVTEGAAFGGIGQIGTNAIVGNPLLDNMAGATIGGAIGGSVFTPFNRRDPYASIAPVLSPSAPVTTGRVESRVAATPGEFGFAPSGLSRTEGQFYQQAVNGQTAFDSFLSPINIDRSTAATPEQVQAFTNISGIPSAGIVQRGNAGTPAPLRMEPTPQPANRGPSLFDVMRQSILNDPRAAQLWSQTPPNTRVTGATPGTIGNAFAGISYTQNVRPIVNRSAAQRVPRHPSVRGTTNSGRRIQPMLAPVRSASTSNLAPAANAAVQPATPQQPVAQRPVAPARPLPQRTTARPKAVQGNAGEWAIPSIFPSSRMGFDTIAQREAQDAQIAASIRRSAEQAQARANMLRQWDAEWNRLSQERAQAGYHGVPVTRAQQPVSPAPASQPREQLSEASQSSLNRVVEDTAPEATPEQTKDAKDVVSELKKEAWKYHGTASLDANKLDTNNVAIINGTVDSLDSGVLAALKDELEKGSLTKGKSQFFRRHVAYTLNRVDERLALPAQQQEETNATQTTAQPTAQPEPATGAAKQEDRTPEVSEPKAAPTLGQPDNTGAETVAGTDNQDDSGVQTTDKGAAATVTPAVTESLDSDDTATAGGGDAGTQTQGAGKTPETPGTPEPETAEQPTTNGKRGVEPATPADAEGGEGAGSPRVEASPKQSDGGDAANAGGDEQPRNESGDGDGVVNDPNVYPYDGNKKRDELLFEDAIAEDYLNIEVLQEYSYDITSSGAFVTQNYKVPTLTSSRPGWVYDSAIDGGLLEVDRSPITVNKKNGSLTYDITQMRDINMYKEGMPDNIADILFPKGKKKATVTPKLTVTIDKASTEPEGASVFEFEYAKQKGASNPWSVLRYDSAAKKEVLIPSSAKQKDMWLDKNNNLHINFKEMVFTDQDNATGDGAMVTLRLTDADNNEVALRTFPILPNEWPIPPKREALERTGQRLGLEESQINTAIENYISTKAVAPKVENDGVQHADDKTVVEQLNDAVLRAAKAAKTRTRKKAEASAPTTQKGNVRNSEVRHIELTPELRARYEAVINNDVPRPKPKTEEQQQTQVVQEQLGDAAADTRETSLDKQELESGNWRGTVLEAVNDLKKKQYELIAKEMQNTRGSKEPLPVNYQSPANAIPYARALAEDFNTTMKLKKSGIPNPARYIKDRRVDINALATDIVTALTHADIQRMAAKMSGGKVSLSLSKEDSDLATWATANGNFAVHITNDQANRLHHYTVVDPATAGSKSPMDKVTDAIMMEAPQARGEVIANPGSCVRQ